MWTRHRLLSTRSAYPLLLSLDEGYDAVSVESGASVVYVKVGRNDCVEHRNVVSHECSEYRLYSVYDLHLVRRKNFFAHLHSTSSRKTRGREQRWPVEHGFEMSKSVDFEDSPVLAAFPTEFAIEVGPELLQHISRRIKTDLYAKL
jgi:hypothetical protein